VCVTNLKYDSAIKDLLRILIKLYENVLKDISNNVNSQIHLNFNDQEFPNDIQAMMFEEENNDKSNNVDCDIKTTLYIFGIVGETLSAICNDFSTTVSTCKDKKSHNKSLGVKRYFKQ
jgi:hypothetical protein